VKIKVKYLLKIWQKICRELKNVKVSSSILVKIIWITLIVLEYTSTNSKNNFWPTDYFHDFNKSFNSSTILSKILTRWKYWECGQKETVKNVETIENIEHGKNTETFDNIESVKNSQNVNNIETVENIETVKNFKTVNNIENIKIIEILDNIETVKNIEIVKNMETVENITKIPNCSEYLDKLEYRDRQKCWPCWSYR